MRKRCKLAFVAILFFMIYGSGSAFASEDEQAITTSIYVAIEPALVTNYGGPGRLRYMSVEVSLRVSGTEGEQSVKHHMPSIKDALLNLFAIQSNETIDTAAGKDRLRQQSFDAVTAILVEENKQSFLEDILFTSFVVYR